MSTGGRDTRKDGASTSAPGASMLSAGPFTIAADDPCLGGHFPGNPLVPAVVILDIAAQALEQATGAAASPARVVGVAQAKFSSPLRPREPLQVELRPLPDGTVGFRCTSAGRNVAEGTFVVRGEMAGVPS